MPTQAQKRKPRTPEEIITQQKADAARALATRPAATPPAVVADKRSDVEKYVDEIAPSMIAGKLIKFSKEGKFVISGRRIERRVCSMTASSCRRVPVLAISTSSSGQTA